jgi:hypothetical protein
MNRLGLIAILGLFLAGACGKPGETTVVGADGSKVTASADGTSVSATGADGTRVDQKVNQQGGVSGTTTAPDGKTTTYDLGGAVTVTEAEIGMPFYPGSTKRTQDTDAKISVNGKATISATRFSTDDVKKVYDFYAGQSMMKTKFQSGDTAMASGEDAKATWTVSISKTDGGTLIIMSNQAK